MKLTRGLTRGLILGGLLLPLIVGVYQVWPRSMSQDWQPAGVVAPPELMEQAVEEHLDSNFDEHLEQLAVMKISHPEQGSPLYVINTRIPSRSIYDNPRCGAIGCLFLGYMQTGDDYQNVLSVYLDRHLPPGIPFIEAGDVQNGMPELTIHQIDGAELMRVRLALANDAYEPVETQFLPM